ncbi:family 4 glycosyl hydrolase [Paenibacillus arenilitoris]|uniref:Glycosyl hydrolase family 4 C-terminal domain-containing protein n=1 Tax=Paenibacillus arenilitoris TaxID=2772299 RepID=A0A927CQU1_9BACL|nr:hypothetical protein [Paenibacillus arenilitoris]MBD2872488.1 hypothetical protein [Paenibacillus arenilitoris]
MNIVVIGGGSFVFAHTVVEDVIVKHRLDNTSKLILVDLNEEAALAMAAAGRTVAKALGVTVQIEATVDREQALVGADYVIVSASPQGARRWQMDYDILVELGMPDQARECGGVGGLLNSFRSITLLMDICRDMERLCPNAMLLDVTNPMPRVVTAIERFTAIKSAGFCNIAYRGPDGYAFLPSLIGKRPEEVEIVTAGLNHFAWVVSVKDRKSGEECLPLLEQYLIKGDWSNQPEWTWRELSVMQRWLKQYGAVAAGAVDHHAEYLPFQEDIRYTVTPPYHGSEEERRLRLMELREIADGQRDWQELFKHPSWEHPVDLAVALEWEEDVRVDILNLRNNGSLSQLPEDRIVEAPVQIHQGELQPMPVPEFPSELAKLIRSISDVHELAARAAVEGNRELARAALEIDPAVTDKAAAFEALDRMLKVHADMLPQFTK